MENKIIIGNMKMYLNFDDIKNYLDKTNDTLLKAIISPSSIYIPYFLDKGYKVAIQNISEHDNGAYTGEVSASQAKSMNIDYVILGHSEVRKNLIENNYKINQKIKNCLEQDLKVILCIGESKEERDNNKTKDIIKKQLDLCLKDIIDYDSIIIAYEPIWAIGTGIIPSNDEIRKILEYIHSLYKVKIIYGGSVDEENIKTLNKIDLDGFIIGSSCINPDKFIEIIKTIDK